LKTKNNYYNKKHNSNNNKSQNKMTEKPSEIIIEGPVENAGIPFDKSNGNGNKTEPVKEKVEAEAKTEDLDTAIPPEINPDAMGENQVKEINNKPDEKRFPPKPKPLTASEIADKIREMALRALDPKRENLLFTEPELELQRTYNIEFTNELMRLQKQMMPPDQEPAPEQFNEPVNEIPEAEPEPTPSETINPNPQPAPVIKFSFNPWIFILGAAILLGIIALINMNKGNKQA